MNNYKSSAELKAMAKEQLFGKYTTAVGAFVTVSAISLVMSTIPVFMIPQGSIVYTVIYYLVSFIISLFIGLFASGQAFFYLKVACGQQVSVGDVFFGFRLHPDKAILIQFLLSLASYLCTAPAAIFQYLYLNGNSAVMVLLMSVSLIAGCVILIFVSLLLSQAFYLLQDFPDYSAKELLKMSCHMMKGHKGRLFYIELSFLPLLLLGLFSCCIAYLWIIPYMNATLANFYMDLVKNQPKEQ
ncbi:putative membrane protein [Kineothrix alysoides]|uniref:Putative membrane protein n=1 Tax=Kineothrix alysoides TaxID=1469948 RepID=A0A4R1QVB7_9FIRM|nr:DUF975 family protein [Kineothrix alysoides]TCL57906.1 putative membrane protein [Kineothrix alysoides]